nr:FecR domain-containing protein [Lachnospiraceae bacterium]
MANQTEGSTSASSGGKSVKFGKPGIIAVCAVAVCAVAGLITFFVLHGKNDLVASTIRFLRMQGEVALLDKNDENISIKEDMRLVDGNKVLTSQQSFAALSLDDYKVISLDQSSKTVINKDGKKLELNLETGALYFNVTKPLEDDEV